MDATRRQSLQTLTTHRIHACIYSSCIQLAIHLDILEAENCLHGHEKWDAGLDGETLVGMR